MEYNQPLIKQLDTPYGKIPSFIIENEQNIDWDTIESFGDEWSRFNHFNEYELNTFGDDYFDIVTQHMMNENSIILDVGCGSGRWSKYVAKRVKRIEAIDPSEAVFTAKKNLSLFENVRVSQASVDNLPFEDEQFDFVFSLGVLHHLPDTSGAIKNCVSKLKKGGFLLLYLYYNLDNRGLLYKSIFYVSNFARRIVSSFPIKLKNIVCDLLAIIIYMPLVLLCRILRFFKVSEKFIRNIPLSYYSVATFNIIRNDAYDRFGTPLEKRFSKVEIKDMLGKAGMTNIVFSPHVPFWHVVAKKP